MLLKHDLTQFVDDQIAKRIAKEMIKLILGERKGGKGVLPVISGITKTSNSISEKWNFEILAVVGMIAGNWGSGKLAMAQNFIGFKYVKSLRTPQMFCVIEAEVQR